MAANYHNSAWFYDRLSRLVYGRALVKAQVYLLKFVAPGSKIIIAGGGTGWILEEITRHYSAGLKITYVEIAKAMMERSRKRNTGENEVVFIEDAVENVALPADYDIVFTPFLFDNFNEDTFQRVFAHLHHALKPGGLWLNTDFQLTGKWWQKLFLRSMFLFFRLICSIEASQLPAIKAQFESHGYETIDRKNFYGEFVVSEVYQKVPR